MPDVVVELGEALVARVDERNVRGAVVEGVQADRPSPLLLCELVVLPRAVLALAPVACRRLPDSVIVDVHAQSRAIDRSPAWAARDRDRLGEDVVLHQVCGLLMAFDAVGQGQDDMLTGSRGEAELTVRVLADLKPFVVRQPGKPVKAPDRSDLLAHCPEVPQSLWNRPGSVRVEPKPGPRAERLPHGRDHLQVLRVVQADLCHCPGVACVGRKSCSVMCGPAPATSSCRRYFRSLLDSMSNHMAKSVNWEPDTSSSATSTIVAVVI